MDSNDCGFVFMPWRLAAAPENCRRPQPAPTRLHAQQKESLTLVTNRNSVAELVAFVRFPLWRSHIVSPRSLHRSRLDDPLWQERAQYARGRALCGNRLSGLSPSLSRSFSEFPLHTRWERGTPSATINSGLLPAACEAKKSVVSSS